MPSRFCHSCVNKNRFGCCLKKGYLCCRAWTYLLLKFRKSRQDPGTIYSWFWHLIQHYYQIRLANCSITSSATRPRDLIDLTLASISSQELSRGIISRTIRFHSNSIKSLQNIIDVNQSSQKQHQFLSSKKGVMKRTTVLWTTSIILRYSWTSAIIFRGVISRQFNLQNHMIINSWNQYEILTNQESQMFQKSNLPLKINASKNWQYAYSNDF